MVKSIIKYIAIVLVAGAVGYFAHGSSFAGFSHLPGIAIGSDGITSSGPTVLSNTLTVTGATTLGTVTTSGTTTNTGFVKATGGTVKSSVNSTSTTATSYTLTQADIWKYSSILMTPNTGSLTLTLPASSTLTSMIPTAGDEQDTLFVNASTTAGITVTFAAGTGTSLRNSTSTLAVPANSTAFLQFVRKANSDILVMFGIGQ